MSSPEAPLGKKKLPVVKLAIGAIVLVAGAVLLLRGVDFAALAQRGMALIREVGPWGFFAAMTVLPAFGVPMIAFTIPAGEAFAAQMGLGGVIAAALVALALNLALAYWVARYALRPLLASLIRRYGYNVPRVTPENALNVTLLVRLTPGPPYALQAYILGIAEVPFRTYMVVSWLALLPWMLGGIILGRGLFSGNFGVAAQGFGVLVVAVIAVQWLRKKFAKRES